MSAAADGHQHFEFGEFGEIGQDAIRLLAVGQEWAQRTFSPPGASDGPAEPSAPTGDCAWCPVCRLAAVIRGEQPETTAKLVAAGNLLIEGLRTLLDGVTTAAERSSASDEADREPPTAPRVQHIDLGDA